MKRVFIIHGWDYNPKINWYPWLKRQLEQKGFEVIVPEMPNTSEPEIESWINHLSKVVGKINENTYFIGHSIGCQTIMRYLESIDKKNKVGGLVFVAGWIKLANLENEEVEDIAKPWLNTPIDFSKVKEKTNKIVVILSENDPFNFLKENENTFKEKLNAKVIIEKNKGHFAQDDGINELPSALNALLEMAK